MPRSLAGVVLTALLVVVGHAPLKGHELDPRLEVLLREAALDEYRPPADGKLTAAQVRNFIAYAEKAATLEADSVAHASDVMIAVEAVKSEGGNWAEHQWVEAKLKQVAATGMLSGAARDPAARHNLRLFLDHEQQIRQALAE